MAIQTNSHGHLIRSQVWSNQLKEVLEDELFAMTWVDMITDFPDGDTLNIASLGQAEVQDYEEGQAVRYSSMDTGNFQFSITDYKASAVYITNKMKQDSFQMGRVVSSFVPKMQRAIMKSMEVDLLAVGPDGQTASDTNEINGAQHRFVGNGTNNTIDVTDFAKALYALQKADVPATNLVAIVDPSVEYAINSITNITNVSNNPMWEGIIASGMSSGTRFLKNIYGFDVYVSHNLKSGLSETIDSTAVTNGVANLFFSAAPDVLPFVGNVRQAPQVDSEYNKDLQRDEYVTTARYGFGFYRPENLVTVITDNSQVYA
jgi:hypothetical protein